VPALLDDLIAFSNRDDVEPVTQAAIAHAQFESTHPFTDGNGRIGRALIGAILRRRGVTPHTALPARREDCSRHAVSYRENARAVPRASR
ncbi:Fic family protein, partial [Bacillus sp. S34]|nr:Fic family protein [Bacillus sp. S34]